MSFNFMAAITICSDFGALTVSSLLTVSIVSPSICHEVMGPDIYSVYLFLTVLFVAVQRLLIAVASLVHL